MDLPNKRTHSRYPMSIPTELIPNDLLAHPMPIQGRTRDISASGAFFWVKDVIQVGEKIKFFLTFDLQPEPSTKPLKVQFWGSVVRVEQTIDRDHGVAVAIQRYKFSPEA